MGKKKCELCDRLARMFCESDQASLCWDCDIKIHGANFLGIRFGPTGSICEFCLAGTNNSVTGSSNQNLKKEINSNDNDDDCEEGEEEAKNQVVPWDAASVMSSSSSVSSGEESFSGDGGDFDLDCSDGCDTSSTSSSSSTLVLKTAKRRRYLSR
ncbi:hypothetical protein N665_1367s0007 [Sinapis alba]|nr:hypothetical protein N665_1367s0007 [Sinapis alba]